MRVTPLSVCSMYYPLLPMYSISCDAVVIVLGESDEMVGESKSRTSLELPGHQNALVKQVHEQSHIHTLLIPFSPLN